MESHISSHGLFSTGSQECLYDPASLWEEADSATDSMFCQAVALSWDYGFYNTAIYFKESNFDKFHSSLHNKTKGNNIQYIACPQ